MVNRNYFEHGDERKTSLPDSAVILDTKAKEKTNGKAQQLVLVCPLGAEGKLDESQLQWIAVDSMTGPSRGIGFSPTTYGMIPGTVVSLNYDNQQNPRITGVVSNQEVDPKKADTSDEASDKQKPWQKPGQPQQTKPGSAARTDIMDA